MTTSDRQNLMIRVAWLYHVEELTQVEVAERLGLTRRAVVETLAEARRSGVVSVAITAPEAECAALESALAARFSLEAAVVVPSPGDPDQLHRIIGRAAGEYLGRMLSRWQPVSIGTSWGETLRQSILHLPPQRMPELTVRSLVGGLSRGAEINTFETVHSFARRLGAECRYYTAPVYADSARSREIILSQGVFRELHDSNSDVDLAVLGAGDAEDSSRLVRYAAPAGSGPELRRLGAVGDLICRFLDENGAEIDHALNRQVFAPELAELRRIPRRVVIAGGVHKHGIMRAIVRGGLATSIVTDSDCARAILR